MNGSIEVKQRIDWSEFFLSLFFAVMVGLITVAILHKGGIGWKGCLAAFVIVTIYYYKFDLDDEAEDSNTQLTRMSSFPGCLGGPP